MKLCLSAAAALVASRFSSPEPRSRRATPHQHGRSLSLYERDANPSVLARQGCAAARRGESGVVVLDFGKPAYDGHHGYGTIDFSNRFVSNHEITVGMLGWARGYVHCLPGTRRRSSRSRAGRATTTRTCRARTSPASAGPEQCSPRAEAPPHGLARTSSRRPPTTPSRRGTGGFRQTRRFIHGYRQFAHGHTLYDYGSLDGGVGAIWSARQMMYVAGGKVRHTKALPEIYYPRDGAAVGQLAYDRAPVVPPARPLRGRDDPGHGELRLRLPPRAAHRALVRALAHVDTGRRTCRTAARTSWPAR